MPDDAALVGAGVAALNGSSGVLGALVAKDDHHITSSRRTRDFEDARDLAVARYTDALNGKRVARSYTKADAPDAPAANERALEVYARRAIAKLQQQAAEADTKVKGKGHKFHDQIRRIEALLPRWGRVPIDQIDEHDLNAWIEHDYRVEDREATVKKYGRQARQLKRQIVTKMPAATTLGNLDWALSIVWDEAVADRAVERRHRPVIDKTLGDDGEPRAFIDEAGVRAVMGVMTDQWITSTDEKYIGDERLPVHIIGMKRLLRCYVALIASTGIRSGLECKRIRLGDVQFETQQGTPVIFVRVWKNQGKHKKDRTVVVFEGNSYLRVRHLLRDLIAYREAQHAAKTDFLFAWADNRWPTFRVAMDTVLRQAGALIDPMSGEKRTPYSFRHFFATDQIARGLSVAQLAEWMGTSSAVVEKHYNRFIVERNAHLVNGAPEETLDHIDEHGMPWRWDYEREEYVEG